MRGAAERAAGACVLDADLRAGRSSGGPAVDGTTQTVEHPAAQRRRRPGSAAGPPVWRTASPTRRPVVIAQRQADQARRVRSPRPRRRHRWGPSPSTSSRSPTAACSPVTRTCRPSSSATRPRRRGRAASSARAAGLRQRAGRVEARSREHLPHPGQGGGDPEVDDVVVGLDDRVAAAQVRGRRRRRCLAAQVDRASGRRRRGAGARAAPGPGAAPGRARARGVRRRRRA